MSIDLEVTAKVPAKGDQPQLGPATIVVQTGADLDEMVEMFGKDAIKTNADANWVVSLQGNIRSGLKKGENQEQLQARLGSAVMGVAVRGTKVDPVQAFYAEFASATPERQAEMLEELKARAAE